MARLHFAQRRRLGSVLAYVVIGFTVMMGIVSFAVDWGLIALVKSELQAAVDAACLAGATGLPYGPSEARLRAKDIAQSNNVNGHPLTLLNSDIELGTWNATTKQFVVLSGSDENNATAIRITAQLTQARGSPISLIFAPLIGLKTADVSSSAVAGFGQAADVVIVQDITGSFSDELNDAKVGDQALIDTLYDGGEGASSIGIVAHTGWGKTMSPLKKLNSNYASLTSTISSLQLCGNAGMPVCSGTDIAAGLDEGIKVFNDTSYPSTSTTGRVMILVSDGEPNADPAGSHPTNTDAQLLTLAQEQADLAWSQGIHVYVVFFNRTNDPAAAAKLATLPRGKGDFVQVTIASELPNALTEITKKLPTQLVR